MKIKNLNLILVVLLVSMFGFFCLSDVYARDPDQFSQAHVDDGGGGGGGSSSTSDSTETGVTTREDLKYVSCGSSKGIPAPVPQLTSALYTILIIATPITLVIFSIVALVKAITSGSQDDIKKAQSKVIKKFIAAALVFFVAGMVQFVITKAADASEKESIVSCIDCLLYHKNCDYSQGSDSGNLDLE